MPGQLNGNQEAKLQRSKANLSCPRNGKWTKPPGFQFLNDTSTGA